MQIVSFLFAGNSEASQNVKLYDYFCIGFSQHSKTFHSNACTLLILYYRVVLSEAWLNVT